MSRVFCSDAWRGRVLHAVPALVAAVIVVFSACSSAQAPRGRQRIAILRCENLTGDPSLDWMGRAFSEMLRLDLAGSPSTYVIRLGTLRTLGRALGPRPAAAPGISAERQAAMLAGATRIVYCEFSQTGGRLRLSAVMEDQAALKSTRIAQEEGEPADVFRIASAVAARIGDQVRSFETNSRQALQSYAEAVDAPDLAAAHGGFERAVAADPNFGTAYVQWFQAAVARQDRAGAERILKLAETRGNAIPEYARARLALDAAELRGDATARAAALATLAKLDPSDPNLLRGLADTALAGRRHREAADYYRQALVLSPDDAGLLNSLGYATAYLGEYDAALEMLRRYERMRPQDANALDSQGDVNFLFSRFAEAERLYLAAQDKDPNFLNSGALLKASQAHLMTGDVAGADAIFERYIGALASRKDAMADYRRAQWQYLSGRRKKALEIVDAVAPTMEARGMTPLASLMRAQAAIWSLALGDSRRARDYAVKAATATAGQAAALTAIALVITGEQPGLAGRLGPFRDVAQAYELLLRKQFAQGAPLLRKLYEQSNATTQEGFAVLLAWALMESGRDDGVSAMLGQTPPPLAGGIGSFQSLYIPRLFFLRAQLYTKQGKTAEAKQNYELFLKLSGPDAEIWGDEVRARAALGK